MNIFMSLNFIIWFVFACFIHYLSSNDTMSLFQSKWAISPSKIYMFGFMGFAINVLAYNKSKTILINKIYTVKKKLETNF